MRLFDVYGDKNRIMSLSTVWNKNVCHPNSDLDHFLLICNLRPEILHPVVITFNTKEEYVILAARLEEKYIRPKIGYFRPFSIKARILLGIYAGMIGEYSRNEALQLLDALKGISKRHKVDIVVLHGLKKDSSVWSALSERKKTWAFLKMTRWAPHYVLNLGEDPVFLWKQMRSKHRSWLRGRERRLREVFNGDIQYKWRDRFDDLESLCQRLEETAAKTYQRGLGAGFRNDKEHLKRFALFADKGWLRIQTIESRKKILAFAIGVVCKDTFFFSETGYDPTLEKFELGTLVFLKLVENLAIEGVPKFDFGFGDAHYKRRFAEYSFMERDLWLYRNSPRALTLWVIQNLFGYVDEVARSIFQGIGVIDKIKKYWRVKKRHSK